MRYYYYYYEDYGGEIQHVELAAVELAVDKIEHHEPISLNLDGI